MFVTIKKRLQEQRVGKDMTEMSSISCVSIHHSAAHDTCET